MSTTQLKKDSDSSKKEGDRRTVFIYGAEIPDSKQQSTDVERTPFTESENTTKLLKVLQPLGAIKSANVQYDTELNTAGVQIVFEKEAAARDCISALHQQRFHHFILHVLCPKLQQELEEERKQRAEADQQPNDLLPHNHLMPPELRMHTGLLGRLSERHGGALKDLREVQNAAVDIQNRLDDARRAKPVAASAAAAVSDVGASSSSSSSSSVDPLAVFDDDVSPASNPAEAPKRCVYFPSVLVQDGNSNNLLLGLLLNHIVVDQNIAIRRWSLAATPFSSPAATAALVVELPSVAAAAHLVAQAPLRVSVSPQQRAIEFRPVLGSDAVAKGWIALAAFPLPAHDVDALFGSREASECVRDLKASLRL